ncbi:MAG: UxaA family hydrolase [Firmicutes bacterium]|nr:UxaA family hydrolase [Bacillota bacterium]
MPRALKINPRDNVAVVLNDVQSGEEVVVNGEEETIRLTAREEIAFGHKIALIPLEADQPVIKYGEEIGRARVAIPAGNWIHLHNLYCQRGRGD